jgi:PAS domain S-box-containing protein
MNRTDELIARESLAGEYASALRDYVCGAGEAALTRAYELGRRAASAGVGILEVAMMHHEALLGLPSGGPGGPPTLTMAAQFFTESLSPFEMTLRSYQANARLLGLSETLAAHNAEIDRAREQLRTILDATTALIYLKDADGRYLFVNERFENVFGLHREEVIGKLDGELLPGPVAQTLRSDDLKVLEARAPQELEEIIPAADGPHTYISLKFPLLDGAGAPYAVCCVATDITERKRADEARAERVRLEASERYLKRAVQARDEFLLIASHELKTPLTSLELQVATLRRLASPDSTLLLSDEKVQSKCDTIVRQVDRLTVLINNLLDVARITSGHLELSPEPVDLGGLVQAVLAREKDSTRRPAPEVVLAIPHPVVGSWDRLRIEGVVANLVSNALKFGDGRPIEIAVGKTSDRATLTVRDRGIGISEEDQRRIFDRFERAVSVRHYGGFGIGLWVARQAVEAHGGTIRVRSREGGGTEFTIELPLAAQDGQAVGTGR